MTCRSGGVLDAGAAFGCGGGGGEQLNKTILLRRYYEVLIVLEFQDATNATCVNMCDCGRMRVLLSRMKHKKRVQRCNDSYIGIYSLVNGCK